MKLFKMKVIPKGSTAFSAYFVKRTEEDGVTEEKSLIRGYVCDENDPAMRKPLIIGYHNENGLAFMKLGTIIEMYVFPKASNGKGYYKQVTTSVPVSTDEAGSNSAEMRYIECDVPEEVKKKVEVKEYFEEKVKVLTAKEKVLFNADCFKPLLNK